MSPGPRNWCNPRKNTHSALSPFLQRVIYKSLTGIFSGLVTKAWLVHSASSHKIIISRYLHSSTLSFMVISIITLKVIIEIKKLQTCTLKHEENNYILKKSQNIHHVFEVSSSRSIDFQVQRGHIHDIWCQRSG